MSSRGRESPMRWLGRRKHGGRIRSRLGAIAGLASLLSALVVVVMPSPASAGAIVACPNGITEWRVAQINQRARVRWEGYRYTLVSSTPRFAVSDAKVLDNGTSVPVDYTVTSERTQRHAVTVAVGVEAKPATTLSFLTTSVSVNVVSEITTKRGVTFKLSVPPLTRLTAEYGT